MKRTILRTASGFAAVMLVLLLGLRSGSLAQGFLIDLDRRIVPRPRPIPEPHREYVIKHLRADVRLEGAVAQVQVIQTFSNPGSQPLEAAFVFPLPYDAAVEGVVFLVDGREYEGKLMDAEEARRIYEQYVRRTKDPALLEWIGTGMFRTSVFPIPPGEERTVTLRYTQLCQQMDSLTEWRFPLEAAKYTSKPVELVEIRAAIHTSQPLQTVYSPTHTVNVERSDKYRAVVKYSTKNETPDSDLRLFFSQEQKEFSAQLISYRPEKDEDGYFLLLATPLVEAGKTEVVPKNVLFVMDRSGSMSGVKLEQAKEALRFVLNNLREDDRFNIIVYDHQVEQFRDELQPYTTEQRKAALGFVDAIFAGGSTNIDLALTKALEQVDDSSRPTYIIFLTDGLPSTGETRIGKIVENARRANDHNARLLVLGVGYDVNSRLLDALARDNYGRVNYVRPDENIEQYVAQIHQSIESPVMTDVSIEFRDDSPAEDGPLVHRRYPDRRIDLFAGQPLTVVGRYRRGGEAVVTLEGKLGKKTHSVRFPVTFAKHSDRGDRAFVEKLWAVRRVGEIIDLLDQQEKNPELIAELVKLAKKHGIVTPYTSFLVEEPEAVGRELARGETAFFGGRLGEITDQETGRFAFESRRAKRILQSAEGLSDLDAALPTPALNPAAGPVPAGGVVAGEVVRERPGRSVLRFAEKTFYWQDGRWVDAAVEPDEIAQARKIERFSEEYFKLIDRYGKEVADYLALPETVVVKLNGQVVTF